MYTHRVAYLSGYGVPPQCRKKQHFFKEIWREADPHETDTPTIKGMPVEAATVAPFAYAEMEAMKARGWKNLEMRVGLHDYEAKEGGCYMVPAFPYATFTV